MEHAVQHGRIGADDPYSGDPLVDGDLDVLERGPQRPVDLAGHGEHVVLATHAALRAVTDRLATTYDAKDPARGSRFTGRISWVQLDVGTDDHHHVIDPDERLRFAMARQ